MECLSSFAASGTSMDSRAARELLVSAAAAVCCCCSLLLLCAAAAGVSLQVFRETHWTRRFLVSPRATDFDCTKRLLLPVDGAQYAHVMEAAASQAFAAAAASSSSSSSQQLQQQLQEARAAAAAAARDVLVGTDLLGVLTRRPLGEVVGSWLLVLDGGDTTETHKGGLPFDLSLDPVSQTAVGKNTINRLKREVEIHAKQARSCCC